MSRRSEAQQMPIVGDEFQDAHDIGMMPSDIPEQPLLNHQHDGESDVDEDLHDNLQEDGDPMQGHQDEAEEDDDIDEDEDDDEGEEHNNGDHDEAGSDEDDELIEEAQRMRVDAAGRRGVERIALNQFLQMIAGRMQGDRQPARDNRELIQSLQSQNVLTSQNVINAFIMVPRSLFVPQNYAVEALADNPIRVAQWEFNISAPHMHATCIEKLHIRPGESFLDVGTGCGICAAIAALLVGPQGNVLAIDTKPVAVNFARENVQRLRGESVEYCNGACAVDVEVHNVFMPFGGVGVQMRTFDKIHVGAQCPEEKIGELLSLLNPDGMLIAPVKQELRLYTKRKDNQKPNIEVVNQVRFGEIEVPSDAQVVMRSIEIQRENSGRIDIPPSTFYDDLKTISTSFSSSPTSFLSPSSPINIPSHSPRIPPPDSSQNWVKRLRSACCIHNHDRENKSLFGNLRSSSSSSSQMSQFRISTSPSAEEVKGLLGNQDIILCGSNFEIKAHKCLLRARAGYFKSQFECGMSDKEQDVVKLPAHFDKGDVQCFVDYIYEDRAELFPQQALQVIEIANYFQVPRLLTMCESVLAGAMEADPCGACDSVCDLLVLADDNGLPKLRTASLNFIAHRYEQIQNTKGYQELQPRHLKMINNQIFEMHNGFVQKLRQMSQSRESP